MDRLEAVRQVVDEILRQQVDVAQGRAGFVHLYGVAAVGVLLALKRGLDPQLAALAGMLHDLWTYQTGLRDSRHGQHSAVLARQILGSHTTLGEAEIEAIAEAIARHSDKLAVDGELAELLKDADVLQYYLYNPVFKQPGGREQRLKRLAQECGLPAPRLDPPPGQDK